MYTCSFNLWLEIQVDFSDYISTSPLGDLIGLSNITNLKQTFNFPANLLSYIFQVFSSQQVAIPFHGLLRAKALESMLIFLFLLHLMYYPSENPVHFTSDIYISRIQPLLTFSTPTTLFQSTTITFLSYCDNFIQPSLFSL